MNNLIDIHAAKLAFTGSWLKIESHNKMQYAKKLDDSIIHLLDFEKLMFHKLSTSLGTNAEEFVKVRVVHPDDPDKKLRHPMYVFDSPLFDLFYYFLMADD